MLHLKLLFLSVSFLTVPQISGWGLLSTVEIVKGYDEFMSAEVDKPKFSKLLKDNEGSRITLEGFMIPIQQDTKVDYFVLSRFPYQSCFFCGAAGPETVVEVYVNDKVTYTEDRVKVEGTLKLNANNPLQLFYVLKDADVELLD